MSMGIFDGKRYFVYGDGASGRAACRALRKNGGKAKIYTDECGAFAEPQKANYDGAVISPGIRPTHAVYDYCPRNGIETLSEAELGFMLAKTPIVGVTGTNGKTTVTRLIADMTGAVACGNIGYPVSSAAAKNVPLVCELSSFQLYNSEHIAPRVAVVTNIASDHIDWHGSEAEYFRCKCNIARQAKVLVLGENIPLRALDTLNTDADVLRCSTERHVDGAYIDKGYFWFCGRRVCPVDYYRLQGKHNLENALCSVAAASVMGADNRKILAALASATLSPHRVAPVGSFGGKRWIDDSKGTNIAATLAAVNVTDGRVCLITGGRDKGLDFDTLFAALDERVENVIAMGESAQSIRDSGAKYGRAITVVNGLSDAVTAAAEIECDAVLLSPACASFDEFDNYAERGEAFSSAVRALYSDRKHKK